MTRPRISALAALTLAWPCIAAPTTRPAVSPAEHAKQLNVTLDHLENVINYFPDMEALKDMVGADDLLFLHDTLLNGRPKGRRAAAYCLAHVGNSRSFDPLRQALRDDSELKVRQEAALTLGHLHALAALPDLIKALQSADAPEVRARAADALNLLGTPPALAAIKQAAATEKDDETARELKYLQNNPGYDRHSRANLKPGEVTAGYYRGTRYLIYTPKKMDARQKRRWLVTVHGTLGNPKTYADAAIEDAEKHNLIVLAPHFDYGQYSWFGEFNLRRGKTRPDLRIVQIVADLSGVAKADPRKMLMFGHSEGAQLVHRFLLVHPHRVERAVAAACGKFVEPDPGKPFPIGTGPNPLAADLGTPNFADLVKTPLAIMVGTADDKSHRFGAERFVKSVQQYAADHGLKSQVIFESVPGGEHNALDNWNQARGFLFPQSTKTGA
jgi:pimeloyl-ACP methyl ester carboxylesterase